MFSKRCFGYLGDGEDSGIKVEVGKEEERVVGWVAGE